MNVDTPGIPELGTVVHALGQWQVDGTPLQLHPGDVGWYWRTGAAATAAAVRTWSRDGRILAVGLLDGARQLRLAIAPDAQRDEALARQLVADVGEPQRGVLPAGRVDIEAPAGAVLRDLLAEDGWDTGEPWTPPRRDLSDPVEDPGVRIEVAGPGTAPVRTAVHRSAFGSPSFTEGRWQAMASGLPYAHARCLVAFDDAGQATASVTVWSAGAGRPGLLEPLGVAAGHRGRGFGRAITRAAAAALRDLGSSSAIVCTPSSNVGAVATYASAGFVEGPAAPDLHRGA
ncbi:GNAT family N-acetyltransferase [Arthrobacter sp. JSM 101049]|uniref:GNAT family N-acetyltransferase n=1 Tax=Arthrobacter sp. JSM 101049 TaxID=929097 RepID=UPI0035688CD2